MKSTDPSALLYSTKFRIAALSVLIFISLCVAITPWIESQITDSRRGYIVPPSEYVGPETIKLEIAKPVSLKALPLEEILNFRDSQVKSASLLLQEGKYSPREEIFGELDPNAKWVSVRRLYYYGKQKQSDESKTFVESAAARLLFNPYLLAKAEFWGLSVWQEENLVWNVKEYPPATLDKAGIPLAPREENLLFSAGKAQGSITYNLTRFGEKVEPALLKKLVVSPTSFGVYFQNARDFGFDYAWLDLQQSKNISNSNQPATPVQLHDIYAKVSVAWTDQVLYNHLSNNHPAYQSIRIDALPAKAVFQLWKSDPVKDNSSPEFTFVMNFE